MRVSVHGEDLWSQRRVTEKVSDSMGSQDARDLIASLMVYTVSLNYSLNKHIVGGGPFRSSRENYVFLFVCFGRFCRSCIATSLKNNKWTCPYCRAYLPSEGVPATDVAKRMKSEYQNCTECDTLVCNLAFVCTYLLKPLFLI